jgi:ketosteroid isomerase-like protein
MRPVLLFSLIASVILTTSCPHVDKVDRRVLAAVELERTDEQWSAAAARKDVAATVAFYAEGAVMLPPNAPIIADQNAIRQAWTALLGPNTTSISWKASKTEVANSGELGYIYGTYEDSVQDPKGGPPIRDKGKTVEIWKKQADGKWKCVVDSYNSDLPPAPAPEAVK